MKMEYDNGKKSFDNLIENIQYVIVEIEKYESTHNDELNINDPDFEINLRKQAQEFTLHFHNHFDRLISLFTKEVQYFTKDRVALVKNIMNNNLKSSLAINSNDLSKTNFECALFVLLLTGDIDFRDSLPILSDYIIFAEENEIDYKRIANRLIPLFENEDEVTREFLMYFKAALD